MRAPLLQLRKAKDAASDMLQWQQEQHMRTWHTLRSSSSSRTFAAAAQGRGSSASSNDQITAAARLVQGGYGQPGFVLFSLSAVQELVQYLNQQSLEAARRTLSSRGSYRGGGSGSSMGFGGMGGSGASHRAVTGEVQFQLYPECSEERLMGFMTSAFDAVGGEALVEDALKSAGIKFPAVPASSASAAAGGGLRPAGGFFRSMMRAGPGSSSAGADADNDTDDYDDEDSSGITTGALSAVAALMFAGDPALAAGGPNFFSTDLLARLVQSIAPPGLPGKTSSTAAPGGGRATSTQPGAWAAADGAAGDRSAAFYQAVAAEALKHPAIMEELLYRVFDMQGTMDRAISSSSNGSGPQHGRSGGTGSSSSSGGVRADPAAAAMAACAAVIAAGPAKSSTAPADGGSRGSGTYAASVGAAGSQGSSSSHGSRPRPPGSTTGSTSSMAGSGIASHPLAAAASSHGAAAQPKPAALAPAGSVGAASGAASSSASSAAAARAAPASALKTCFGCGGKFPKLLKCSGCSAVGVFVGYCSKECQREDWRTHKQQCGVRPT